MSIPIRICSDGARPDNTWIERVDTGARWKNVKRIQWGCDVDGIPELTLTFTGRRAAGAAIDGLLFLIEEEAF